MTANELIDKFNDEFGLNEYPETYEVDHETYANVCQFIFDWAIGKFSIRITIGPKKQGIMFRGVELILKEKMTKYYCNKCKTHIHPDQVFYLDGLWRHIVNLGMNGKMKNILEHTGLVVVYESKTPRKTSSASNE